MIYLVFYPVLRGRHTAKKHHFMYHFSLFFFFFYKKKQHAQERTTTCSTQLIRIQSESHGYHKDDTQKDKGTNNTYFNKPDLPLFLNNLFNYYFFCMANSGGDGSMDHPPGPKSGGIYIPPPSPPGFTPVW